MRGQLVGIITKGRVAEAGLLYDLLRRRERRRGILRNPWIPAAVVVAAMATAAWIDAAARSYFGIAGMAFVGMWTVACSFWMAKSMLDSGMIEELLLTPIGIVQVWADTMLLSAERSTILMAGVVVVDLALRFGSPGFGFGSGLPFQMVFFFPPLAAACAVLGGRLAFGISTAATVGNGIRRAAVVLLRIGAVLAALGFAGWGVFLAIRAAWRAMPPVLAILAITGTVFVLLVAFATWRQARTGMKPVEKDTSAADAAAWQERMLLEAVERMQERRQAR